MTSKIIINSAGERVASRDLMQQVEQDHQQVFNVTYQVLRRDSPSISFLDRRKYSAYPIFKLRGSDTLLSLALQNAEGVLFACIFLFL